MAIFSITIDDTQVQEVFDSFADVYSLPTQLTVAPSGATTAPPTAEDFARMQVILFIQGVVQRHRENVARVQAAAALAAMIPVAIT